MVTFPAPVEALPSMQKATWKIRRRIITVTLLLCAFVLIYLLFQATSIVSPQ